MLSPRIEAPSGGYDPPLGQPGTLTSQTEAGHLSLQRRLTICGQAYKPLFDEVHGYGWRLLTLDDSTIEESISPDSRDFFFRALGGKCISIMDEQDSEGEYREWFKGHMGLDHVILIRPDFYVFGHAPKGDVEGLVRELRTKLGWMKLDGTPLPGQL